MGDKLTAELVNREALVILDRALKDDPMPEWRASPPGFLELETSGPKDQAFIGLYVRTGFLDQTLHDVSIQIALAVIELARRIKATGRKPSARSLELPGGTEAARNEFCGIAMRTVIMDHPAPTRETAQDFGGRVIDYFNTDLDAFERRCCVKAVRFDVPLMEKETETNATS